MLVSQQVPKVRSTRRAISTMEKMSDSEFEDEPKSCLSENEDFDTPPSSPGDVDIEQELEYFLPRAVQQGSNVEENEELNCFISIVFKGLKSFKQAIRKYLTELWDDMAARRRNGNKISKTDNDRWKEIIYAARDNLMEDVEKIADDATEEAEEYIENLDPSYRKFAAEFFAACLKYLTYFFSMVFKKFIELYRFINNMFTTFAKAVESFWDQFRTYLRDCVGNQIMKVIPVYLKKD